MGFMDTVILINIDTETARVLLTRQPTRLIRLQRPREDNRIMEVTTLIYTPPTSERQTLVLPEN